MFFLVQFNFDWSVVDIKQDDVVIFNEFQLSSIHLFDLKLHCSMKYNAQKVHAQLLMVIWVHVTCYFHTCCHVWCCKKCNWLNIHGESYFLIRSPSIICCFNPLSFPFHAAPAGDLDITLSFFGTIHFTSIGPSCIITVLEISAKEGRKEGRKDTHRHTWIY